MDSVHPKRSKHANEAESPSPSVQESLPAELITEILVRLPVKSLLKFRCVSKSWLYSISSPEFVKIHLSFSAHNKEYTHHVLMLNFSPTAGGLYQYNLKDCTLRSLFHHSVTEAFDVDYPLKSKKMSGSVSFVGSVNGIICLALEDNYLFLWNPSTRNYKRLPDPKPKLRRFFCWQICGFGYDHLHDDYKVVVIFCVVGPGSSDKVEVKMYSLKSDSWTSADDYPSGVMLNISGKFVNGKLHWPTTTPGLCMYKGWNIISMDLANGKWEKVEQPCYGDGDIVLWLGVLGSDLSVFCNNEETHVDVWVMKEYGIKESWTKMFTINYPYDPRVDYGFLCFPSFMSRKGEILVYFGSTFMIYNPKDDSFRDTNIINFDGWREAGIYAESLVGLPKEQRMRQKQRKHRSSQPSIE